MTLSKAFSMVFVICAVAVVLLSCDPEKDALGIFTHQGLVVLRPARDYIKVGGIVVLPKHGGPEYLDPYNDVSSDPTTYVDFKAVILGQTKNQATGLETALSGLTSVMPLSAKLGYKSGQTVQLSQIDTGGRRILTRTVNSLLKEKATGDELRSLLNEPGNEYRAFVVQEVYTGKSITLKTDSNNSLDVSYGGGGSLPDCSSPKDSGSSTGKTGSAGRSPGKPTSTNDTKASSAAAKTLASPPSTKTTAGTGASSGPSVSLGACKSGDFALTLQSQDPIPFAVRLNEIILSNGVLSVKYGDFKFPPTSLGSGEEVEKATAVLDPGVLNGVSMERSQ
jgi:hypothetical protein